MGYNQKAIKHSIKYDYMAFNNVILKIRLFNIAVLVKCINIFYVKVVLLVNDINVKLLDKANSFFSKKRIL